MLNNSARIGSSVSGGKPVDTPLSARRIKLFTTAFESRRIRRNPAGELIVRRFIGSFAAMALVSFF